jgi:hypothetical protein
MVASLHVIDMTPDDGTVSLVLKIQSDTGSGFPSSTDRITFAAKTHKGLSDQKVVAGALTGEDYWRVNATITGGTVKFVVALGVA